MDEGGPERRGQGTVKPADRSRGRSSLETGRRAPRRQTGSSPFPVTLAPSDKARVSLGLSSPVLSFSLCPSSVSISVSSSHSLPLSLSSHELSHQRGDPGKEVNTWVVPWAPRRAGLISWEQRRHVGAKPWGKGGGHDRQAGRPFLVGQRQQGFGELGRGSWWPAALVLHAVRLAPLCKPFPDQRCSAPPVGPASSDAQPCAHPASRCPPSAALPCRRYPLRSHPCETC